jgi:hypothetical protein
MKLTTAVLILAATALTACATTTPTSKADAQRAARAEQIANRMDRK